MKITYLLFFLFPMAVFADQNCNTIAFKISGSSYEGQAVNIEGSGDSVLIEGNRYEYSPVVPGFVVYDKSGSPKPVSSIKLKQALVQADRDSLYIFSTTPSGEKDLRKAYLKVTRVVKAADNSGPTRAFQYTTTTEVRGIQAGHQVGFFTLSGLETKASRNPEVIEIKGHSGTLDQCGRGKIIDYKPVPFLVKDQIAR